MLPKIKFHVFASSQKTIFAFSAAPLFYYSAPPKMLQSPTLKFIPPPPYKNSLFSIQNSPFAANWFLQSCTQQSIRGNIFVVVLMSLTPYTPPLPLTHSLSQPSRTQSVDWPSLRLSSNDRFFRHVIKRNESLSQNEA